MELPNTNVYQQASRQGGQSITHQGGLEKIGSGLPSQSGPGYQEKLHGKVKPDGAGVMLTTKLPTKC